MLGGGGDYAHALFAHLFEDPKDLAAHGLRIPVRLWRSTGDATSGNLPPPAVPPLDDAARTIVVVLVDEYFMAAEGWHGLIGELAAAKRPVDLVIGVSLDAIAMELNSRLCDSNLIRLHVVEGKIREAYLVNRVTHALCRLVAGTREPVKVFVSHAKQDGLPIAKAVRKFLHDGSGLDDFFDAQDLLDGSSWKEQIRGEAACNVLLAIRTDAYARREWCRVEILRRSSPDPRSSSSMP